jgi:hypothetical protein
MDSYRKCWENYKCLKKITLFLVIGFIPAGMVTGVIYENILHAPFSENLILTTWMLAGGVAVVCFGRLKCPRCHKLFYWEDKPARLYEDFFRGRSLQIVPYQLKHNALKLYQKTHCVHCGLVKYAVEDTAVETNQIPD